MLGLDTADRNLKLSELYVEGVDRELREVVETVAARRCL